MIFDNKICKFEVKRNDHIIKNKKVNVVTSVFFKRGEYYKNFGIYVKGLSKLVRFIDDYNYHNRNDRFAFLLFIDHNVLDDSKIMGILNRSKNTIPVLFKCSEYMKGDYHLDLFGTLVRFFPMFDFPNNPCKMSIVVDIDLHREDYIKLETCMKNKPKGFTGAGTLNDVVYDSKPPYIIANTMSYNQDHFDHNLITHFIEHADEVDSLGTYGKRFTTFGFGIDEIFINEIFCPKIKKFNFVMEYQHSYFFFHSRENLLKPENRDITKRTLEMILKPILDSMDKEERSNQTAEMLLDILDEKCYMVREKTQDNDNISINLSEAVKVLKKENKTWLEKPVIEFINKHLLNLISSILIISYDYDKNEITKVEPQNPVYDSTYKE